MLLLGAVQLFEPVNGYQIRRELVSWRVDEWAHINPGLDLLRARDPRPRRAPGAGTRWSRAAARVTVYTTTVEGRAEFQRLFAEAVRVHDRGSARGFTTALSLQPLVDRAVFLGLLEERLVAIDALIAEGEALAAAPAGVLPPHLPPLIGLWQAQARTERAWLVDTDRRGPQRRPVRTPSTPPTGRPRPTTRAGPCRPTASATARPSASPTEPAHPTRVGCSGGCPGRPPQHPTRASAASSPA